MGTHPIFESDFDCLTDIVPCEKQQEWPCVSVQEILLFVSALRAISRLGNRLLSKFWKMLRLTRTGRSPPSPFHSGPRSMGNRTQASHLAVTCWSYFTMTQRGGRTPFSRMHF